MDDAGRWLRLVGRPGPVVRPIELRAGPLTALLDGPDLRHIRVAGVELVQRIYVAVRDAPWNTIPAVYTGWQQVVGDDRFRVTFTARHRHGPIDVEWRGRIEGTAEGVITYEMDGVCHGVFQYSKIGFNVHHDLPGSVGRRYRARHGERVSEGVLPRDIEPQRIVDGTLSGMFDPYEELAIEVADGLEAVVRIDGDLLELQDHRNWTDANFKSYATPLALGFPFDSVDGQRIRQRLRVTHRGTPPQRPAEPPTLLVGPPLPQTMPSIGLGVASDGRPLAAEEAGHLRALRPAHLRVDLPLADAAWEGTLDRAIGDARAVTTALELAVHARAGDRAPLDVLVQRLRDAHVGIARVLVYPAADGFSAMASTTPPSLVAEVERILAPVLGGAVVAGGTDQSFADINRARPTDPAMRGLCFAVSPTIHAADDASIIENLVGQSEVVRFARAIAAPRSIHVSPVTLATRFGPYPAGPSGPEDLPPAVDVRQLSLLGAAWTAASIGELARAGAASATYYETAGWRGVLERLGGSPQADRFPSRAGEVFPLYHALADALEVGAAVVLEVSASDPLVVGGWAARTDAATVVVLANLTGQQQDVRIEGLPLGTLRSRTLDLASVGLAGSDPAAFRASAASAADRRADAPWSLGPYATARLVIDHGR